MAEWFDETVGKLLAHLDQSGLSENTIALYISDNGWVRMPESVRWTQQRAKVSPYEAGLRTPIMMR